MAFFTKLLPVSSLTSQYMALLEGVRYPVMNMMAWLVLIMLGVNTFCASGQLYFLTAYT
jgi:hypothetical protein